MSKNKNINKRVWQRFLQESPFDEMVKEFRSNNDIPLTGFENRKEASKWRKKGLNEQRYEEFCREIAGLTLNKCYSYIFDTGSMIVPILFDYVLFYPKDKMKGVFSRIDKGCHIIYPHYGSQSMGVDLPQDFPEHHRKKCFDCCF